MGKSSPSENEGPLSVVSKGLFISIRGSIVKECSIHTSTTGTSFRSDILLSNSVIGLSCAWENSPTDVRGDIR